MPTQEGPPIKSDQLPLFADIQSEALKDILGNGNEFTSIAFGHVTQELNSILEEKKKAEDLRSLSDLYSEDIKGPTSVSEYVYQLDDMREAWSQAIAKARDNSETQNKNHTVQAIYGKIEGALTVVTSDKLKNVLTKANPEQRARAQETVRQLLENTILRKFDTQPTVKVSTDTIGLHAAKENFRRTYDITDANALGLEHVLSDSTVESTKRDLKTIRRVMLNRYAKGHLIVLGGPDRKKEFQRDDSDKTLITVDRMKEFQVRVEKQIHSVVEKIDTDSPSPEGLHQRLRDTQSESLANFFRGMNVRGIADIYADTSRHTPNTEFGYGLLIRGVLTNDARLQIIGMRNLQTLSPDDLQESTKLVLQVSTVLNSFGKESTSHLLFQPPAGKNSLQQLEARNQAVRSPGRDKIVSELRSEAEQTITHLAFEANPIEYTSASKDALQLNSQDATERDRAAKNLVRRTIYSAVVSEIVGHVPAIGREDAAAQEEKATDTVYSMYVSLESTVDAVRLGQNAIEKENANLKGYVATLSETGLQVAFATELFTSKGSRSKSATFERMRVYWDVAKEKGMQGKLIDIHNMTVLSLQKSQRVFEDQRRTSASNIEYVDYMSTLVEGDSRFSVSAAVEMPGCKTYDPITERTSQGVRLYTVDTVKPQYLYATVQGTAESTARMIATVTSDIEKWHDLQAIPSTDPKEKTVWKLPEPGQSLANGLMPQSESFNTLQSSHKALELRIKEAADRVDQLRKENLKRVTELREAVELWKSRNVSRTQSGGMLGRSQVVTAEAQDLERKMQEILGADLPVDTDVQVLANKFGEAKDKIKAEQDAALVKAIDALIPESLFELSDIWNALRDENGNIKVPEISHEGNVRFGSRIVPRAELTEKDVQAIMKTCDQLRSKAEDGYISKLTPEERNIAGIEQVIRKRQWRKPLWDKLVAEVAQARKTALEQYTQQTVLNVFGTDANLIQTNVKQAIQPVVEQIFPTTPSP